MTIFFFLLLLPICSSSLRRCENAVRQGENLRGSKLIEFLSLISDGTWQIALCVRVFFPFVHCTHQVNGLTYAVKPPGHVKVQQMAKLSAACLHPTCLPVCPF